MTTEAGGAKRKEIYTYTAPWLIYGMNWSVRADQRFRLAIGSFEEEYSNSVRIVQLDEETHKFQDIGGFGVYRGIHSLLLDPGSKAGVPTGIRGTQELL